MLNHSFRDIINAGKLADEPACWDDYISDRGEHNIGLKKEPEIQSLSQSELGLIETIYEQHGDKDQWQIRDWCHMNCGEWEPLQSGRSDIPIERIAERVGKSPAEAQKISDEARESSMLRRAFTRAKMAHA